MSLQTLKMMLAPPLWHLLSASWRILPFDPPENAEGPFIFACLHRDILPALCHVKPEHPCLLISNSLDGDILVATLGPGKFGFVRGSTGSGGGRALVGLRRILDGGGSVGVAVDGPRGPYGLVQEGILHLARLTGVPVVPLRAQAHGAWTLGTWDRTLVPYPFAAVDITTGPWEYCTRDSSPAELLQIKVRLENFFCGQEAAK